MWLLAIPAIAVAAIWFVAFSLLGDRIAYLGYVNAGGFFFGLAALAAGVFLLFRRRAAGLPGVVLGLVILRMGVALPWPGAPAPPASVPLRFVTASLRTANSDMADAARTLAGFDADVLAVQEANNGGALLAALRRGGGSWNMVSSGTSAIFSRLPIRLTTGPAAVLGADIEAPPGATARVWTFRAPKTYAEPSEIGRWFAAITERLPAGAPDIVAGDFNATPWNGGYRTMATRMTDAFRQGGTGPGFTFPTRARRMGTLFPFVRIDHVFVGRRVHVARAFVGRASRGADHFPVVADLLIARRPGP